MGKNGSIDKIQQTEQIDRIELGKARSGQKARPGQGKARPGQGKAMQGKARQGKARQGKARHSVDSKRTFRRLRSKGKKPPVNVASAPSK